MPTSSVYSLSPDQLFCLPFIQALNSISPLLSIYQTPWLALIIQLNQFVWIHQGCTIGIKASAAKMYCHANGSVGGCSGALRLSLKAWHVGQGYLETDSLLLSSLCLFSVFLSHWNSITSPFPSPLWAYKIILLTFELVSWKIYQCLTYNLDSGVSKAM